MYIGDANSWGSNPSPRAHGWRARRGARRGARHHPPAAGAPSRDRGVPVDGRKTPGPGRAGRTCCRETAEVDLRPLLRRPAQRVLEVRLHPLPPDHDAGGARGRHRDPDLARRPFP